VHDVLEQIDFKKPGDVKVHVGRNASTQHLALTGPEVVEAIPLVQRFLDSPVAAELAAAKQIHRELEFMLAWPPDEPALGGRYLHGYIDCLYQTADGAWRILDYKTNRVSADQVAGAAQPYEMQMFIYALATERVLGRAPDDLSLYFLRPAVAHPFRFDDENRARVERLVNQTMEAAVEVSR
jgi:ATP-dependent exoDNAse (exonuclease V) beta subunit